MPHPAEQIFEDETITEGLTDEQASELLAWLLGLLDEMEEGDQAYLQQLKEIGRQIARISSRWGVPVGRLIDLVETAWAEPDEGAGPPQRPMRA